MKNNFKKNGRMVIRFETVEEMFVADTTSSPRME